MKKIFDHAYEGLCNSIQYFIEFIENLGELVLIVLIYITIPLWIIPYLIYKKWKGERKKQK